MDQHWNTIKYHKNTRDQKMIANLMHARIDRQKYAIPAKYSNRYQLGNSSESSNCQNTLETAPKEAPWPLD